MFWHRQAQFVSRKTSGRRVKRQRSRPLLLELLEDRSLLSTNIPLNGDSWMAMGPGPIVNLDTNFTEPVTGRIAALAAHPKEPNIIYVAAAGGGVWKTSNADTDNPNDITWTPLTDSQETLFMGAIALAPSDPNTIYAGTGEAHLGPSKTRKFRDNIYYGRGVLKSEDAGDHWRQLGRAEFDRRTISKIVVAPREDPASPDVVYVAVGAQATNGLTGHTGVWKSIDGGEHWDAVVNGMDQLTDTDAVSDLVMDPFNPQHLYAAVGTPEGSLANGVYETVNGGASWSLLSSPLVSNDSRMGRITLAISPSTPGVVFGVIAHSIANAMDNAGLLRIVKTTNGGQTWSLVPRPPGSPTYLGVSGDYHNTFAVDPAGDDILYAGGETMIETRNGGTPWNATFAPGDTTGPHRDHHGIGFDAKGRLLDGNDGGIWRWDSQARTWTNLNGNLQITQFVGIELHPTDADIAFGGTQDNGMLRFWDKLNPEDAVRWQRLERADGGAVAINRVNPRRVYHLRRTGTSNTDNLFFRRTDNALDDQMIMWSTHVSGITAADKKNFYLPFVRLPGDLPPEADRLVLGTDKVYRTISGGTSWTPISARGMNGWPDITDNIDGLAVAPSDVTTIRTVYATAGGHILVSFNANAVPAGNVRWQLIDIPGFADHFSNLLVDPTNNLIVYAVRDRFSDGPGGHVFRGITSPDHTTTTWTDISGDLPDLPTYSIALDERFSPNILYVGTDSGVYASTDSGASWSRFQTELPNVQVADLKLNTTLNILAAGTHGRGMWEILVSAPSGPRASKKAFTGSSVVPPELLSRIPLRAEGGTTERLAASVLASADYPTRATRDAAAALVFANVRTETDRAESAPRFVPYHAPGDNSLDALFSAWRPGLGDEDFSAHGIGHSDRLWL